VVVGSEKTSEGVSMSGVNWGAALGGKAGKPLSSFGWTEEEGGFFVFFLRRAIRDS